jgi:hypothetical protein
MSERFATIMQTSTLQHLKFTSNSVSAYRADKPGAPAQAAEQSKNPGFSDGDPAK